MRVKYLLLDAYCSNFVWLVSGLVVEKASFAEHQTPFVFHFILLFAALILFSDFTIASMKNFFMGKNLDKLVIALR